MSNKNKRYFQYLAGPQMKEILIFDKIEKEDDMIFVSFTDGSRVNEEFIQPLNERKYQNKLMAEISDPSNPWTFEETWTGRQEEKKAKDSDGNVVIVQPFIEGTKKITPIPPKKLKSSFGNITNNIVTKQEEKISTVDLQDPVFLMMEKSKKIDTNIEMTLILSLPSQALYNVAKDSFDNGDNKVIEYIIKNINKESFEKSLKQALFDAYENKDEFNESSISDKQLMISSTTFNDDI